MPREYKRKGQEKLTHNLSVPLTEAMMVALRLRATQTGELMTTVARRGILREVEVPVQVEGK